MPALATTALDATLIAHGITPRPAHQVMVVNPAVMAALRENLRSPDFLAKERPTFMGVPVHEKPDQLAPCYAFKDYRDAAAYLSGEVNEKDLEASLAIRTSKD